MKNTLKVVFYLFIGLTYSYSIQAQEKTREEIQNEFNDYLNYVTQLENFQKLQAKGIKSRVIPRPWGFDPVLAEGENVGNAKSWELYRKTMGNLIASEKKGSDTTTPLIIEENERLNENTNDFSGGEEVIPNFGTDENQVRNVRVKGGLDEIGIPTLIREEAEDNHAFSIADPLDFKNDETIQVNASLNNLFKNGTLSGDYDVYEFIAEPGRKYLFDVENTGDESLTFLAFINTGNDRSFEIQYLFSNKGTFAYTASDISEIVNLTIIQLQSGVFPTLFPDNPDAIYAVGDETTYTLTATEKVSPDRDLYRVELKKGDVFGVIGTGDAEFRIGLASLEVASGIAINGIYGIFTEENSPLPMAGDYGFHYVVPQDGPYFLFVDEGFGSYEFQIAVSPPGLEIEDPIFDRQVIFLNMAGAEMSLGEFFEFSFDDPDVRTLSGLESFMTNWDLERRQVTQLANKIEAIVTKKLRETLTATGNKSDVLIFSDFGEPFMRDAILDYFESSGIVYSRLIIGGTLEEFNIQRRILGVASSIDVGNFDLSDNAIVLLDLLSSQTDLRNSINSIPMSESANKIDLVAEVVGNIATHEAGHFLGNWHVDNTSDAISIMDRGGQNIATRAGVLSGDAYGSDQNIALLFQKEGYSQDLEEPGFLGVNETDINTSYAIANPIRFARKGEEDTLLAFLNRLNGSQNRTTTSSISSYPNPQYVDELSRLVVQSENGGVHNISLYDLQGRKVSELFKGELEANQRLELDMIPTNYNLKSGVYFYKINNSTGQRTHRIVVE